MIATFSLLWVSEKFAVLLEDEEYSYVETSEKGEIENKLKTLFISSFDLFELQNFPSSDSKNINSCYSFTIKEFSFESLTPPPELV